MVKPCKEIIISLSLNWTAKNKKMIVICQRCGKEIDKLECYSGQLCLTCYEREYEEMSEEEKRPDFKNVFNKALKRQ